MLKLKSESKSKLAQTTMFVIIAVCIIGFIVILLFIEKDSIKNIKEQEISPDVLPVYDFVQDCLKMTGEDSLVWIGNTGGYLIPSDNSLNDSAYYFYNGESHMPSKESIENNISSYFDNFLSFCFRDFIDLPDFTIDYGSVKTKTRIENNSVFMDVNMPLTILKGDKKYYLKDFQTEIPVRLDVIYEVNRQLMDEQMKKKDAVCFSCLKRISEENNVTINMFDAGDNGILFVISDDLSKINDKNYLFYFVNKYD